METVSSISLCRVLYEYLKNIEGRRKKWIKYANQIGAKSFNLMSTMDVCDNMLRWMDKTSQSYYIEEEILKAFKTLEENEIILKIYLEYGSSALCIFPSNRTGYRRLQAYSNKVLKYCDEKVLRTVLDEAHIDTRGFYNNYANKVYRV